MTQTSQSVLITGATDGLGKAAALLLAERGYRVFAAGRSPQKRGELDRIAAQKGWPLETLEMDVREDASVQRAVQTVLEKNGALNVLINNAGVAYIATIEDLSIDDWRRQFETNVFGVLRVTQAVLPHMRERRKGRIIIMSSVAGLVTVPGQGAYSSSKHAIEAVGNALRLELLPFGIHTVLIEPGMIRTGIQQAAQDLAKPYEERVQSGLYAQLYAAFLATAKASTKNSTTTPEDCARIILRAIEDPQPKARYGVTPTATLIKLSKRLLSDGIMDNLLRRRLGIVAKS